MWLFSLPRPQAGSGLQAATAATRDSSTVTFHRSPEFLVLSPGRIRSVPSSHEAGSRDPGGRKEHSWGGGLPNWHVSTDKPLPSAFSSFATKLPAAPCRACQSRLYVDRAASSSLPRAGPPRKGSRSFAGGGLLLPGPLRGDCRGAVGPCSARLPFSLGTSAPRSQQHPPPTPQSSHCNTQAQSQGRKPLLPQVLTALALPPGVN